MLECLVGQSERAREAKKKRERRDLRAFGLLLPLTFVENAMGPQEAERLARDDIRNETEEVRSGRLKGRVERARIDIRMQILPS